MYDKAKDLDTILDKEVKQRLLENTETELWYQSKECGLPDKEAIMERMNKGYSQAVYCPPTTQPHDPKLAIYNIMVQMGKVSFLDLSQAPPSFQKSFAETFAEGRAYTGL